MMMMSYGLVTPASGFLIPQLEDSNIGFGINKDQGSWLGTIYLRKKIIGHPTIIPTSYFFILNKNRSKDILGKFF